jgi:hypothetical protein
MNELYSQLAQALTNFTPRLGAEQVIEDLRQRCSQYAVGPIMDVQANRQAAHALEAAVTQLSFLQAHCQDAQEAEVQLEALDRIHTIVKQIVERADALS